MSSIEIRLIDNSVKTFEGHPTVLEVAKSISPNLAKQTFGAFINGSAEITDIREVLSNGDQVQLITSRDKEAVEVVRHSCAHVLAQAVQSLWPEVKVTIGPVVEHGFYYDFDSEYHFTEEDLPKIEKRMSEIIKSGLKIEKSILKSADAISQFKELGEKYKVELIEDLVESSGVDEVSIYHNGMDLGASHWFDLCRGPHVSSTGAIKAFKLLSVAGSYWRGDENREKLQRIYGTAFLDKKELALHLERLEEAKKRDHRKLGKELDLFHLSPISPGGPFFTGKGSILYNELQSFLREKYHLTGYQEVITPQIFDVKLYEKSGHLENYSENMYFTRTEEDEQAIASGMSQEELQQFSAKPMNCPGHCVLYSFKKYSYRDLPYRIADFGRLHRFERSGTMHGLTRVRTFCQDDAHIFCRSDQVFDEIKSFMNLLKDVYTQLGMPKFKVFLSTRPEKRMGSDEIWDQSEEALSKALESLGIEFDVNEGDGAFYGPKIDIMFVDALERPWQLGTLQCDFNLPYRFDLKYTGEDNGEHRPIMLHRAILGSLERFIGVYLEHTAGKLPTWLSPVQVQILNVTSRQDEYCSELEQEIKSKMYRVHFDDRSEKLGFKIREAQLQKIPYMLIIGDKELEDKTVSVRLRDGKEINGLSKVELFAALKEDISNRCLKSPLISGD